MNDLQAYADIFRDIQPWRGSIPEGFSVDFLGTLVDLEFMPLASAAPGFDPIAFGGGYRETALPDICGTTPDNNAETWFEAVDWIVAAREARGTYVMMTLGANYAAQAVGAYRALAALNPMPYRLVAVEPGPENYGWIRRHMRDNGIDPDAQWIVPLALSDRNDPVYFPVGGAGIGANNCFSTNHAAARRDYAETLIAAGQAEDALRNLLTNNATGLTKDLADGIDAKAEIKVVSAITLRDLLGPFDCVDYVEADMQQSEILVFPPCIDLLRKKVRRIHIGTHGAEVHAELHRLFEENGWEMVFSYAPNARHESALGTFDTNDGVLTVRNPLL